MLQLATPVIAGVGVAQLPVGLLAIPVVTVLFPALSARANVAAADGFRRTIAGGLNALTFTMLPATAGLIILATDAIRILFERGAFGPTETARTAEMLVW